MQKHIFLATLLAFCTLNFGANAAAPARGNARGGTTATNASSTQAAPVAARAGARQKVVGNTGVSTAVSNTSASAGGVAARAGKKQTVVSAPSTATAKTMAARAGATQKVVQTGSKVATATANTAIPQECQDAFYGCMDSLCFVDNMSGARCQCSDQINDLDKALEEIQKMDEYVYYMANEGVQRIQMGENADEIMARAKAAADKVSVKDGVTIGSSQAETPKNTLKKLDLSSIKMSSIYDDDDDDIFADSEQVTSAVDTLVDKRGNELYTEAAKMCVPMLPSQCKQYSSVIQAVYGQKIKSDCSAYRNDLNKRNMESKQKYAEAQTALRQASLDKFQEENKYDRGACIQQYAQCMEKECGSDYSKCVTFAADENIRGGSSNAASRTIKGIVDIVLSGSTMTQLNAYKAICDDSVLKYCVKHRDTVWDGYLLLAATQLRSAELNAEDNLRQNCIKTVADCFKSSCAANYDPNGDSVNYDMCLSDPMLVYDSCKIRVESCIVATGGKVTDAQNKETLKASRLWTGVTSMLAALRVDACTKEVKAGIESICGKDFAHCVGLNPGSIAELLPTDTLTACKKENNNDKNAVLQYIYEVAQGYALQINDALYTQCENAAKQAMMDVCGGTEDCESLDLGNISFDSLLTVKLCKGDGDDCKDSVETFAQDDIIKGLVTPHIRNRIDVNGIKYDNDNKFQYEGLTGGDYVAKDSEHVKTLLTGLDNVISKKIATMESNRIVKDCMTGKNVTGFRSAEKDSKGDLVKGDNGVVSRQQSHIDNGADTTDTIFTNLLDNYKNILIDKSLSLIKEEYANAESAMQPQLDAATDKISERLASIEGIEAEKIHTANRLDCEKEAMEKNISLNTRASDHPTVVYEYDNNGYKIGIKLSGNNQACTSGKNSGGFCRPGERLFFDTGSGRNKNEYSLRWWNVGYDETNSKCTFKETVYNCTKKASPYCWGYDTTGVAGEERVIQKPRFNKEMLLVK